MLVLFTIRWLGCKKDSIEKVCQIIIRRKLKLKLAAFLRWLINNQYFTLPDLHLLVNKSLSIPNWKIARRVKILPCSRILRRIRRFILYSLHSSHFATRKPVSFLFLFPLFLDPLIETERASVARTFAHACAHLRVDGGSASLVAECTCDYTSAYLMGRVARTCPLLPGHYEHRLYPH